MPYVADAAGSARRPGRKRSTARGSGPCTNPDERNVHAPVSTILDRGNARTGGTLGLQLATVARCSCGTRRCPGRRRTPTCAPPGNPLPDGRSLPTIDG
ncbi:hypothetical protein AB0873_05905 [Micromonospora sp. NPDC047707]|uniref:hypothetical protein n=1 Tax=Micromonospora sp. NPDC047707 TaxID=3154498 RepID=UPI003455B1D0